MVSPYGTFGRPETARQRPRRKPRTANNHGIRGPPSISFYLCCLSLQKVDSDLLISRSSCSTAKEFQHESKGHYRRQRSSGLRCIQDKRSNRHLSDHAFITDGRIGRCLVGRGSNLWGMRPLVREMQSEGGAAGVVHGSCRQDR